ncbi:MAG: flavodoxin [Muribaculaceae bacterium]|nr:flavodoxin [Muribaculaceae bacterium]
MKTGIFYGSTTGTTADVASRIANALNVAESDVHDVASVRPSTIADYDFVIFGSSTWGDGDLQEDWGDFIDAVQSMSLAGKKVAIFGCGDETMSNTFCNAVGKIYDAVKETGAEIVGAFNTFPYQFDHSDAVKVEGAGAVGLLLDEVNHADATDKRIADWIKTF